MTATVDTSKIHPTKDDTSSMALEPPVLTTQESLAQAAGSPVSSHILPSAPHQPLLSEFDIQDTPNHPKQSSAGASLPIPDCLQALVSQGEAERRALRQVVETHFATHLFSLEATLAQCAPTTDVVADLAASSLSLRSSLAFSNVSTAVERNVPLLAQPWFFGAELPPPTLRWHHVVSSILVQFESVAVRNGRTVQNKAQALVQLYGAAVEYLEYIPQAVCSNYEALVSALETRFGNSHLLQLYFTQLKHVR
ncbi:hypothetical protein HPB51_008375 [Rhipicephalus microplus]|uniref:Uncharacterized protein n=1 Tax=Rhipicephalus microplus TaxID=6941 RepID=A0A9J6DTY5_RHIMP|nr:hypothetical protein HPB51_008375 [Rhipicephalus microplus]